MNAGDAVLTGRTALLSSFVELEAAVKKLILKIQWVEDELYA